MATTVMRPPVPLGIAVILFVEEFPDQPPGRVHVYEVAPATGVMLYVCCTPLHTATAPAIGPGDAGALPEFTVSVCGVEVPQ